MCIFSVYGTYYIDFINPVFATSYNEVKSYVGILYVYKVSIWDGNTRIKNVVTEIRKRERENMSYTVLVEEVVSQEFAVEASSPEEALRLAEDSYRKGEIVLEPVSMKIVGDAEWVMYSIITMVREYELTGGVKCYNTAFEGIT